MATTSSRADFLLRSILSMGFTRLTELTELDETSVLPLFVSGELDVELPGISLELEIRFGSDGRRRLITAFLVCDAGNLIILMAVGENPIDDCRFPISLELELELLLLAVTVA